MEDRNKMIYRKKERKACEGSVSVGERDKEKCMKNSCQAKDLKN